MIEISSPQHTAPTTDPNPNTPIVMDGVGFTYDPGTPWAHEAVRDVSLTIQEGSRLLMTGENGSGKSTLAWILAGLRVPTSGTATLGGRKLNEMTSCLGILLQHTRLALLSASVAQEFKSHQINESKARLALNQVGLEVRLDAKIDRLSVGQQRRLGLAILLARQCSVVVLDEPLAGLDAGSRRRLFSAVETLPPTTTVITVTHDVDGSAPLGNSTVELAQGSIKRAWSL